VLFYIFHKKRSKVKRRKEHILFTFQGESRRVKKRRRVCDLVYFSMRELIMGNFLLLLNNTLLTTTKWKV